MSFFRRCRLVIMSASRRSVGVALASLAFLCALPALSVAYGQSAPAHSVLRTRNPVSGAAVANATYLGQVSPTAVVPVTLVLPLQNEAALNALIPRLYDPNDPLYGRYLTSQQFEDQYAPTASQVAAVTNYALTHGFVVNSVSDSRFAVHLTGTAGAVASAFGVGISSYVAADGRPFTMPDKDPVIPSELSGKVMAVLGLDQSEQRLSYARRYIPSPSSPGALPQSAQPLGFYSTDPAGLTPADIRSIYGIPKGGYNGAGQTLGLFELDTYTPGDITTYESTYGLGNVPLTNIGVNNFPTTTAPGINAAEVTLDIELQLALASSAKKILVYEDANSAGATFSILDKMAMDDLATTISSSWGIAEDGLSPGDAASENMALARMASQGQSFFAAAGDSGAYDDGATLSVDDPASQPFATGVGGTNLMDTAPTIAVPTIEYVSESAWSDTQDQRTSLLGAGGGGGISSIWAIPSWQVPAITAADPQGSTTMRNVPDVSLCGDYDTNAYSIYFTDPFNGAGFYGYNGTSAAAPLWSAFAALVNQARRARVNNPEPALGFMNPALYKIGANAGQYAADFHDINDGSNNLFYNTVTGYDNATGLGTINSGGALINDLILAVTPPVISSFTPTFGPVGTFVTITGTGLAGATQVTFNGTPAVTFTAVSAVTVTAVVPPGATSGPIGVTTPNGIASSPTNFDLPPVITSFTPTSGPYGTVVTITGVNFLDTEGVAFTGPGNTQLAAAAFAVLPNTTLTATVPVGTITGPITVTTPAGKVTSAENFTLILPPPTITSFAPVMGPVTTTVTIMGTSFFDVSAVSFNGVGAASFTVISDTMLTAVVPVTATTGPITVITPGGIATSQDIPAPGTQVFTVVNPVPTITSFTPTSGPALTIVTIVGTGFYGVQSVTFNGLPSTIVTTVSPNEIIATVPNQASTGLIRVTTPGGTAVSAVPFTVVNVAPRVTGFNPTVASIGFTVTITGVGFGGTTGVTIDGIAAAFTVVSDGAITCVVPFGAVTGPVTVIKGQVSSTAANNLVIVPQITGFTPAIGPVGTTVTITGTSFAGLSAVRFDGVAATTFSVNGTTITAVVPVGAQTGPISIVAASGQAFSATAYVVGIPAAAMPTISGFTPAGGPVGTVVTITGTNFTGATSVKFNGAAAAVYAVVSATTIRATVPAGATSGPISVVTPTGTAVSSTNFDLPPTFAGFTPAGGPDTTIVTITGTNLKDANPVTFNGIAATVVTDTNTQLVVVAPLSTSGPIRVTTSGGSATSAANYDYPPSITAFSPAGGPAGTVVTITGVDFLNTTSVTFNGVAATAFTVVSNTSLTATTPAGAGTGYIVVTGPGGSFSTTDLPSATYTNGTPFFYPPTITSFTPVSGTAQVTTVTLTGANLFGATAVKFNGTTAIFNVAPTVFSATTAATITAAVPLGATTGPITVTTPGGSFSTTSHFTVLPAIPVPTITSFSPTSGPPGTVVTITGTNFEGTVGPGGSYTTTSVVFGTVRSSAFTIVSPTEIMATVPGGVTTGPIQVTTTGGVATSAGVFSAPPIILSFNPSVGSPVSTIVTINGSNFTAATTVAFNGVAAAVTVISSTQLSVTVPTGATNGPITATTAFGTASTAPLLFYLRPTITSFTPPTGLPGTTVTITGTNFLGATSVTFNGVTASFVVLSNTTITATVPSGSSSGTILVTTPGGTASSTMQYALPPTVSGFTPTSGTVGTLVTITGANFTGATSVTFNGLAATVFTVVSDSKVTAIVPVGATSGPISVTTLGGTATTAGSFTVVIRPLQISGFSPTSGFTATPAGAGTVVTLIGAGFSSVTSVFFNGVPAVVTSQTDTQLVTSVPAGATTGPIVVTGGSGTAVSGSNFIVLPAISALSPASGKAGQSVVITGSAFLGATIVRFNGLSASFTVNSSAQITAIVPVGTATGYVSVATPSGTAYSPVKFTIVP